MAKKISELSLATHSSVTPQARILVNEVNASSSTGYTTKQMSIDELNQELMENYHYLTSNDISGDSGSQSSNIDQRYYYLDDENPSDWQKICPVVFYDPEYEALFVIDKDSTKRYIDNDKYFLYGPQDGSFDSSVDYTYGANSDASYVASRLELFDYNDEYEYVASNASTSS